MRSLKLRHQNGQLHIVPFGQVGHITNFSRDWTVVKFNLAFAHGTDVELLRKTVKKLGLDMMEEPTFKPILMQPLKMQGVVDIKDNSLIVRFKFMARAQEPQPGPAHGDPPHVRDLPGARHPVRDAELSVCHRRPACCTVTAGRGPDRRIVATG